MKFEFSYNDLEPYFGKLNPSSNNNISKKSTEIKHILFIDTQSVLDHNELRNCVNVETVVISYNSVSTKRRELGNVLKRLGKTKKNADSPLLKISIERFGFVFSTDTHLDNTRFIENATYNDPANVQWLVNIVKRMNIKTIDFFGCNTLLHQEWRKYYNYLITWTSATIYANSRFTGNPNMGGSWQFEQIMKPTYSSDDVVFRVNNHIDKTYFNPEISKYPHLLDYSFPQLIMIDTGNNVWVCGRNSNGQLGLNNTTSPIYYLTSVTSPLPTSTIKSVGGCSGTLFIIYSTGELYASGANGSNGGGYGFLLNSAYGSNTVTGSNGFVQCSNLTSGKKASTVIANSGSNSSCLYLMTDGTIYSLGSNSNGDFGIGAPTTAATLTAGTMQSSYYSPAKPIDMQHTGGTTIILMDDGTVWGCGLNIFLGINSSSGNTRIPTKIAPPTGQTWTVKQISVSTTHVLLLTNTNKIYGTGQNSSGQLGIGSNTTNEYSWVEMTLLSSIIKTPAAISTGISYSIVLFQDGSAYACGSNTNGQFGIGTTLGSNQLTSCLTFLSPDTSKKISAIQCFSATTIVLASDGTAYSCGSNSNGIMAANDTVRPTQRTTLGKMYKSDTTTPMTNVRTFNINYDPIVPITVPSAPTITNITASSDGTSQTITITQPAPTTSSPAPTTYYYSTDNWTSSTVNANTSSLTFAINVQPGTAIRIKAYNGAGLSLSSNPITVGNQPSINAINPVLFSSTSLTVSYSASINGSPTVTKHEYSINAGATFANVMSNPFTIAELTPGTSCTVIMRALSGTAWISANSTPVTGTPYILGSQPTIGTITPGKNQLSVAFSQSITGTSPTTYYYSTDGTTLLGTGVTISPLTINEISSAYTFYIIASNPAGTIRSLTSATGTPYILGSKPTISLTCLSSNQLTVTYAQSTPGTSTTSYYYVLNNGLITEAPASPFTLYGLTSTSPYSVYVLARNPAGDISSNIATGNVLGSQPSMSVASGTGKITVTYSQTTLGTASTSYYYVLNNGSLTSAPTSPFDLSGTALTNTSPYSIYILGRNPAGDISSNIATGNVVGSTPTGTATHGVNKLTIVFTQTITGTLPTTYYYSYNADGSNRSGPISSSFDISNIYVSTTAYIIASNPAGNLVSSGITGTPYILGSQPTIGTVTPSRNQLSVAFSQSITGTSPTTYYYSSDGSTKIRQVTSPFDISNITTQQTIYVIASNPAGDITSTATQGTPYVLGTTPIITKITPGTNSLLVDGSGSTGGYPSVTTYLYSLDGGEYVDANTSILPITITISNPIASKEYLVQIKARNAAGDTPSSNELGGTPIIETRPQISPALYWSSQYWTIVSYWRNLSYWSKRR